jgi:hypothetical protein
VRRLVALGNRASDTDDADAPLAAEVRAVDFERHHAPPTGTKLYVNLALASNAARAAALDVDGVGRLRAEFMLTEALQGRHPVRCWRRAVARRAAAAVGHGQCRPADVDRILPEVYLRSLPVLAGSADRRWS